MTTECVELTTAQVRKLARLTRLHSSDSIVRIEQDNESDNHVQVEWLDEYGYRVPGLSGGRRAGYAAVVRENGWSNPPVARMAREVVAQ